MSLHKAEIHDAGRQTPQSLWRKVKKPGDVDPVIVKPPAGRKRKYVDERGNVKYIRLVTAAALREDLRYERNILRMTQANGGIAYGQCPLRSEDSGYTSRDFPEELQSVCEKYDAEGRAIYGEHQACPHVEHIIKARQAKAKERDEERNRRRERAERMEQRKLEMQEKQNEMLLEILKNQSGPAEGKGGKRQ